MYVFEFWIVFHTCFAFKFCISSFFDTIWFLKNKSLLMFSQVSSLFSVSPFSFIFFILVFRLFFLEFFHFDHLLVQVSKNIFVFVQSLFFFHLLHLSSFLHHFFAFICFNISFSIWSFFSVSPFSYGFFFEFFFSHFLCSHVYFFTLLFPFLSFFLSFSPFFLVSSFTFIFGKLCFHSLSLSWCRCLFPPKRKKNLMESPRERCEEPDRMCSENCIVWTWTWA